MDYRYFYINPNLELGGVLNLKRIPALFLNYLGIREASFLSEFPFIQMATTYYWGHDELFFGWKEQTISLSVSSPWLIVGAIIGTFEILKSRIFWPLLCSLFLFSELVLILSYWLATQRYAAELLPWLTYSFAWFLMKVDGRKVINCWAGTFLILLSVLATVFSTATWHAYYAAPDIDIPRQWQNAMIHWTRSDVQIPEWSGEKVYVAQMKALSINHTFVPPEISRFPMIWGFQAFPHSIFAHAETRMEFEVPAGAVAFESVISLAESGLRCNGASLQFEIQNDREETLFVSDIFTMSGSILENGKAANRTSPPEYIRIALENTRKISLIVRDGGNGIDCDHGAWLSPAFLIKS